MPQSSPLEIPALLKYAEIVRDIASRKPGHSFLYYDTQFRQARETIPLPWDRIHTELWVMACTAYQQPSVISNRPFRSATRPDFSKSKRFWENTCWPYNRQSGCRNQKCSQPHICGYCKGSHTAATCQFSSKEQASRATSSPSTEQSFISKRPKNTNHTNFFELLG